MTVVNLDRVAETYGRDIELLSMMFRHTVIEDDNGTWRWKRNRLNRWVLEGEMGNDLEHVRRPYNIDLNAMCSAWYKREFSIEEYMKWQMDTGYSLCGFEEIFGQRCDAAGRDLITQVIENHERVIAEDPNVKYDWQNIETEWNDVGLLEYDGDEYAQLGETPLLDIEFLDNRDRR